MPHEDNLTQDNDLLTDSIASVSDEDDNNICNNSWNLLVLCAAKKAVKETCKVWNIIVGTDDCPTVSNIIDIEKYFIANAIFLEQNRHKMGREVPPTKTGVKRVAKPCNSDGGSLS